MFFDLRNEIVLKQASLSVGIDEKVPVEQAFRLSTNYPNPATGHTMISYSLPYDCNITLAVFDPAGNKVFDIVNVTQSKGTHVLDAEVSHLATGIYYIRFQAGNNAASVKLVIIK